MTTTLAEQILRLQGMQAANTQPAALARQLGIIK